MVSLLGTPTSTYLGARGSAQLALEPPSTPSAPVSAAITTTRFLSLRIDFAIARYRINQPVLFHILSKSSRIAAPNSTPAVNATHSLDKVPSARAGAADPQPHDTVSYQLFRLCALELVQTTLRNRIRTSNRHVIAVISHSAPRRRVSEHLFIPSMSPRLRCRFPFPM